MAGCREINHWTFVSLVGAFVDIGLAYLTLCGSALAYFSSKFLGILGLGLPCGCNGLFGDPNSTNHAMCVQSMLVEYPIGKIAAVQTAVLRRFPYGRIFQIEDPNPPDVKRLETQNPYKLLEMGDGDHQKKAVESCCSYSEALGMTNLVVKDVSSSSEADKDEVLMPNRQRGRHDGQGRGQKTRSGFHRQRKVAIEYAKVPIRGSTARVQVNGKGAFSGSNSEWGRETSLESMGELQIHYDSDSSFRGKHDGTVKSSGNVSEVKVIDGGTDATNGGNDEDDHTGENDAVTIKNLKEALEEEHAARSALYVELEKERSAAATAADEAMSMISRLQEEKASIEMEARQYKRMVEEKYTYDEEEMNILKEILLRREREKLVLEKEVEVYRKMLFGGEDGQLDEVNEDQMEGFSDISSDPMLLLQQINDSLARRKAIEDMMVYSDADGVPEESKSYLLGTSSNRKENESSHGHHDSFGSTKENIVSMGDLLKTHDSPKLEDNENQYQLGQSPSMKNGKVYCGPLNDNENRKTDSDEGLHDVDSKEGGFVSSMRELSFANGLGQLGEDANIHMVQSDKPGVLSDKVKVSKDSALDSWVSSSSSSAESTVRRVTLDPLGVAKIDISSGSSHSSRHRGGSIVRSSSDNVFTRGTLHGIQKNLSFDWARNSLSDEKEKLESEVERLTERLRYIQEGKEKLSLSLELKEKEKTLLRHKQGKHQLGETRQSLQPEKDAPQASLPPLSSKSSKKRRSRSRGGSTGKNEST